MTSDSPTVWDTETTIFNALLLIWSLQFVGVGVAISTGQNAQNATYATPTNLVPVKAV